MGRTLPLVLLLLALPLAAQDPPLVVTPDWLATRADDPRVVVLHVGMAHDGDSAYRAGHIPGARPFDYRVVAADVDGLATELPDAATLQRAVERVGVSDATHVVITGPTLMATRVFYALDWLGVPRLSILRGGLPAWRAAGHPVATGAPPRVRPGRVTVAPRPAVRITAEEVRHLVGHPGFSFIDTRSQGEYDGTADRRGDPSHGHLPGARRLEWQEAFEDPREFTPRDRATLGRMWRERVAPGDTVIAYCWVGYRASATYVLSRLLGYPVRLYDGSDQDWQRRGWPLSKEPVPLRTP